MWLAWVIANWRKLAISFAFLLTFGLGWGVCYKYSPRIIAVNTTNSSTKITDTISTTDHRDVKTVTVKAPDGTTTTTTEDRSIIAKQEDKEESSKINAVTSSSNIANQSKWSVGASVLFGSNFDKTYVGSAGRRIFGNLWGEIIGAHQAAPQAINPNSFGVGLRLDF